MTDLKMTLPATRVGARMAFMMGGCRRAGSLVLPTLVFAIAVLVPLAYASPPDPVWVPGVYDDADYDNVVVLVTSSLDAVACAMLPGLQPVPPAVTSVLQTVAHPCLIPSPASAQPRAPPAQ